MIRTSKAIIANLPYRRSGIEKLRDCSELVIDELVISGKEDMHKAGDARLVKNYNRCVTEYEGSVSRSEDSCN